MATRTTRVTTASDSGDVKSASMTTSTNPSSNESFERKGERMGARVDENRARLAERVDEMSTSLKTRLHDAGLRAREMIDGASTQAQLTRVRAEDTVRRRPLTATLIAFGAGVVLTRLLSRSNRRY